MTQLILVTAAALALGGTPGPSARECVGAESAPRLDHVVLIVGDLEDASAGFRSHGFRLKPGRLHANNLLNRHIKFRDGSSIELMTVRGEPGDAMAQGYSELLAAGEGAVYVALGAESAAAPERAAVAKGLEPVASASGPWRFVSFPETSPAAAVFFSAGAAAVQDPDSLVSHRPEVTGLAEAWLEGGRELGDLLVELGARRCGLARSADGRGGERFGLGRGTLVVVPARDAARPRVLGAVLRSAHRVQGAVRPHPRFWVRYEPSDRRVDFQ